jgi:hypothetical protein
MENIRVNKYVFIIIFSVLILYVEKVYSGDDDHLIPENGYFSNDIVSAYNLELSKTFKKHFGAGTCLARAVCITPFQPEWGISVQVDSNKSQNDNDSQASLTYKLIAISCKNQYWPPTENKRVEVEVTTCTLEKDIAFLINKVWIKVVKETQYRKRHNYPGLDSTTYYFYCEDNNVNENYSGKVYDPKAKSIPSFLAKLADYLATLTLLKNENEILTLKNKITKLSEKILTVTTPKIINGTKTTHSQITAEF